MGFFDEIAFGRSSKPRVTKKEYNKAKGELRVEGLTERERAKVDEIFASDYNMPGTDSHPKGLERDEVKARVDWMRKNKSVHGLSDHRIDEIEEVFTERL